MTAINCNGCTACCHKDVVVLTPEEAPRYRSHLEWHNGQQLHVLDRDAVGSCVYVAEDGCSIHGEAPGICRRMDCRDLYRSTTPHQREARVRQNVQMLHIYTAAAERLSERVDLPDDRRNED